MGFPRKPGGRDPLAGHRRNVVYCCRCAQLFGGVVSFDAHQKPQGGGGVAACVTDGNARLRLNGAGVWVRYASARLRALKPTSAGTSGHPDGFPAEFASGF